MAFVVGSATPEVQAQTVKAVVTLNVPSPGKVRIQAECPPSDSWSFRNAYAGILGLGKRIENFQATNSNGESLSVRTLAPGEFRSTTKATSFSYEVTVLPPKRLADMSHVSWLKQDYGFLMLADLLPRFTPELTSQNAILVELQLPNGWSAFSSMTPDKHRRHSISDPDGVVFFVGRDLREKVIRAGSMELSLVTVGEWAFEDSEALSVVARISREYTQVTRYPIAARSVLMLAPFVGGADQWTAETRGATVVLLVGGEASRAALLGRLKVVLAHELLHLWVPNALAVTGDYDWFFEGFTLYEALLTSLHLKSITFSEYLDTLGRLYDSYRSSPERDKLSLLEASERRWTTASSFVYEKGMLVALLYDLSLRRNSKGNASLSDLYPQLFHSPRPAGPSGSEFIMGILDSQSGMDEFSKRFIRSPGRLELLDLLAPFGIKVETAGAHTRLAVIKELSTEQRKILRSLGYR
ncbi:MAG: hypothetical protein ABI967_03575 [bacterium]